MKASYFAGLVRHLLEASGHPDIVKVEPSGDVGAVGFRWGPSGLKVTYRDGTAVYLSTARTSAPGEDLAGQPDVFDPADLGEQRVS